MIAPQSLTLAVLALRSVVAATLKFGNCFTAVAIIFLKLAGSIAEMCSSSALDLEAEAGGEVLLVADHHVDIAARSSRLIFCAPALPPWLFHSEAR